MSQKNLALVETQLSVAKTFCANELQFELIVTTYYCKLAITEYTKRLNWRPITTHLVVR